MKKALLFLPAVIALSLSVAAQTTSLQNTDYRLAKETFSNLTPYSISKAESYTNTTKASADKDSSVHFIDTRYNSAVIRLRQQAVSLKEYAKANQFNTDYCFLVDMSIPSGKKRFFVYNLKKDSLESSFLVAHGAGSSSAGYEQLQFSNTPNSYKTSLGKYKIGNSYYGTYGLAFKLTGLDSTNSKAFERAIVLHSFNYVPDSETYPKYICESAGCPMVSRACLAILNKYITTSSKPVLMWIYN